MKKLRPQLDKILQQYIKVFEQKHDVFFEGTANDDLFNILHFGDYFFSISDIVYDIDNNLPDRTIFDWQDHCLEFDTKCNLESYAEGYRADEVPLHKQISDLLDNPYPSLSYILKRLPCIKEISMENRKLFLKEDIAWDLDKVLKEQEKKTLIFILNNIRL